MNILGQVRDSCDCLNLASFYYDKEHDDQKQLVKENVYFILPLLDNSLSLWHIRAETQGRNLVAGTGEEAIEEWCVLL